MGFSTRRGSDIPGVFETAEPIPIEEWDERTAKRQYALNGFSPQNAISPGFHTFRAENNMAYRHAVLYHNAAIDKGYHSVFTQINRHNWHVAVSESAPVQVDPLAGISDAPPGSGQWLWDVVKHRRVERGESLDGL